MYRKGAIRKNEAIHIKGSIDDTPVKLLRPQAPPTISNSASIAAVKLFTNKVAKARKILTIPNGLGDNSTHSKRSSFKIDYDDMEAHYEDRTRCCGISKKWKNRLVIVAAIMLIGFTIADLVHWSHKKLSQEWAKQEQELKHEVHSTIAYAKELQTEMEGLRRQMVAAQDQTHKLHKQVTNARSDKNKVHENIQRFSKQMLLSKFGPGPYYVEVQLEFDPESNVAFSRSKHHRHTPLASADRFVLEMAPTNEMPHTVHWFLQQVSLGLYDGFSFHLNARHVIQAGGVSNFRTTPETNTHNLYQRFKDNGLEKILFQEYSHSFPHVPYTVGYASRPGGPDFYINMNDNTNDHGPGGQINAGHFSTENADPCFAKVVEGFAAVNRIHRSATHESARPFSNKMVHNVVIKHMRIAPKPQIQDSNSDDDSDEE